MSRQDVAQEFVQWARGDIMMALHAMAGCIELARARLDCERSMEGVPESARRQLRHDLRMQNTDTSMTMELRWLMRDEFAGFEQDADGEEHNVYKKQGVLQYRDKDGEWIDVPTVFEDECDALA